MLRPAALGGKAIPTAVIRPANHPGGPPALARVVCRRSVIALGGQWPFGIAFRRGPRRGNWNNSIERCCRQANSSWACRSGSSAPLQKDNIPNLHQICSKAHIRIDRPCSFPVFVKNGQTAPTPRRHELLVMPGRATRFRFLLEFVAGAWALLSVSAGPHDSFGDRTRIRSASRRCARR